MQHLPGDSELPRRFGNREIERREDVLPQDFARVCGLHRGWLLGRVLRHRRLLSGIAQSLPRRAAPSSGVPRSGRTLASYRIPLRRARPPLTNFRIPLARARRPLTNFRIPLRRARPPLTSFRIPLRRARPPLANFGIPLARGGGKLARGRPICRGTARSRDSATNLEAFWPAPPLCRKTQGPFSDCPDRYDGWPGSRESPPKGPLGALASRRPAYSLSLSLTKLG